MNPREKMIVGYIIDYFFNNKAPSWKKVGPALKECKVHQLFGGDILPDDFLKVLFESDSDLLKLIPDFQYRHYQIIMMLMKEEYSLTNCVECGHFSKNTSFNWRRRFASFQRDDDDVWDDKETSEKQVSTPDTIRLQSEEDTTSDTPDGSYELIPEKEEDEPRMKKSCRDEN